MTDLVSLNKEIINVKESDTPSILCFLVPSEDQEILKSEVYVRLRSLPEDTARLVENLVEAQNISNKMTSSIGLKYANPILWPSGVVELSWKLSDDAKFKLIINSIVTQIKKDPTNPNNQIVEKKCLIKWRYDKLMDYQRGEFTSLDELDEFVEKAFTVS